MVMDCIHSTYEQRGIKWIKINENKGWRQDYGYTNRENMNESRLTTASTRTDNSAAFHCRRLCIAFGEKSREKAKTIHYGIEKH